MIPVHFTFHGGLSELLPRERRGGSYSTEVTLRSSLFDAVQAQGVPHPEVAQLTRNDRPAGWDELLEAGDRVGVHPLYPIAAAAPDTSPRFLLDIHLGRLAGYLRLLGFDTRFHTPDIGDPALVREAVETGSTLLSCDRHLLMHRALTSGRLLRSRDPRQQAPEVLDAFGLRGHTAPFSRCMKCNGELKPATLEQVKASSPPLVKLRLGLDPSRYRTCAACGRLYWPGTHWERMGLLLQRWGVPHNRV